MDDGGAPGHGAQTSLPEGFEDLEPFVPCWVCESSAERSLVVSRTPLPTVQAFYDTVLAHGDAALRLLEQWPLDRQPEDAARLFKLLLALTQASVVIEAQGRVSPQHAEFFRTFDGRPDS